MSTISSYWQSFQDSLLPALINSGLTATALLIVGIALVEYLKRRQTSAATRRQVWVIISICLIALPFASTFLPSWKIPDAMFSDADARVAEHPEVSPAKHKSVQANGAETFTASTDSKAIANEIVAVATSVEPSVTTTAETSTWFASLWFVGFLSVCGWTLLGWCSLLRLRWCAENVATPELLDELHQLKRQLGIRSRVNLIVSSRRDIPMTWGIVAPTIHLPSAALNWTVLARRDALLHELAHVRRRDCLIQLLSRLATALYWYNPLVWMAAWRLRSEQEASCDDAVLNQGITPADYAVHLTQIVVGQQQFQWESALALGVGRLEQRVSTILNQERDRRMPSLRVTVLRTLLIAGIAVELATAGPSKLAVSQDDTAAESGEAIGQDGTLADIRSTLIKKYVKKLNSKQVTRSAIEGMLSSLNDPYSQYISAEELANMNINIQGELSGIGARLTVKNEYPTIEQPIANSPAVKAGLKPDDVILEINSKSAKSIDVREAARQIRGPIGSVVTLKIGRGDDVLQVNVTRGKIVLASALPYLALTRKADDNRHMIDPDNAIGYVRISSLTKNTPAEVKAILQKLKQQGLKGAILDLRFCPGGTLKSAAGVADLFLKKGKIVIIRGRDGDEKSISAKSEPHLGDLPIVVVINEWTASAGEIVAGALQDNKRAKIVGTRTFGKASVQSLLHLNKQLGAIKLTTAYYLPPNGRHIDRMPDKSSWGIDADDDYFVSVTPDQLKQLQQQFGRRGKTLKQVDRITPENLVEFASDPQLAAALKTMQSKLTTGQFATVGGSSDDLEDYVRRSEIRRRQEELIKKLKQLDDVTNQLKR